jgi:hypothetical protein
MRLADKDVQKIDVLEPDVIELPERLDRADRGRSGYGAETDDRGFSLQAAELHQVSGRVLQFEIGRPASRADPSAGLGRSDIHHGVLSGEMVIVIVFYAKAVFHIIEKFRYGSVFHTTS